MLIEVKYARSHGDFNKIEKEVMEDSVAYLRGTTRYTEIVVFIYDESCSVQEHDMTAATLRSLEGVMDVVIVSRPSQLPHGRQRSSGLGRLAIRRDSRASMPSKCQTVCLESGRKYAPCCERR